MFEALQCSDALQRFPKEQGKESWKKMKTITRRKISTREL